MLEIPCAEGPLLAIEAQRDLAFFEDHPVVVPQDGEEYAAFEVRPTGVPVDVEIDGERRLLPPFENIEPPNIVAADSHVVWDDIEDQPDAMRMERIDERPEIGLCADFRIEAVVIDDVVTMGRTWARLHDRRGVDVTYPEVGKVRHQVNGVAKGKLAIKLKAISGADRCETFGQPVHPGTERRRASSINDATRRSSPPSMISSTLRDKRRRQFGCASVVPGRFACSVSETTSSSCTSIRRARERAR